MDREDVELASDAEIRVVVAGGNVAVYFWHEGEQYHITQYKSRHGRGTWLGDLWTMRAPGDPVDHLIREELITKYNLDLIFKLHS